MTYGAGSLRSGTRSAGRQMLEVVRMNTSFGDRSFAAAAPRAWNRLPDVVRNSALTQSVGRQARHPACKKLVLVCC